MRWKFILGVAFLSLAMSFVFWGPGRDQQKDRFLIQDDCLIRYEKKSTKGQSLDGLIPAGSDIVVAYGFYDCNEIDRDDVIVYNFPGSEAPLAKIVKAVPGDRFKLVKRPDDRYEIHVNQRQLKNSLDEVYNFNERQYQMLFLYERDYGGVIPEAAYLILGNLAGGTLDSSSFGLVGRADILGKVIY